ncbi:MAG: hypothetical protein ACPK85_09365 [Methanosarcina sp.]
MRSLAIVVMFLMLFALIPAPSMAGFTFNSSSFVGNYSNISNLSNVNIADVGLNITEVNSTGLEYIKVKNSLDIPFNITGYQIFTYKYNNSAVINGTINATNMSKIWTGKGENNWQYLYLQKCPHKNFINDNVDTVFLLNATGTPVSMFTFGQYNNCTCTDPVNCTNPDCYNLDCLCVINTQNESLKLNELD